MGEADWFSGLRARLGEPVPPAAQDGRRLWDSLKHEVDPAEKRPQANPDVIWRELQDRKEPYVVLKNVKKKTYMRLSAAQFALWRQMDGQVSVQDLIVEHYMATGNFAHAMILQIVDELARKHMLVDAPIAVWTEARERVYRRTWGHRLSAPARFFLTQRLALKKLDKGLGALYKYGGRFFFTKPALFIYVLLSAAGLFAFLQIVQDPRHVFIGDNYLGGLALIWLASLLPVFIHELGHALTVKHYGREVPQGGLMLYLGMPAAFVETTDIWLEPRRARLAVTWNGPFTGLIIGGSAALIIYFFPTWTLSSFLFKMAGFAYLTVFMNVNPLLKYDGYYILSDALDIPLLRERSMAFIRTHFLRYLVQRRKFSRDEKVFAIYGVLSVIWTGYAIYAISFFWNTRVRAGIEVLLGSGYSVMAKVFSFVLVAALVSLFFLILLSVYRLLRGLVAGFIRSGGLARHGKLGLIAGGLALALGVGVPALFPGVDALWLSIAQAALAGFAAYQLFRFSRPYFGSVRGAASWAYGAALVVLAVSPWLPLPVGWIIPALVILANLLILSSHITSMKIPPLLLGVLTGAALALLGGQWFDAPLLLGLLGLTGTLGFLGTRGGARGPAILLINLAAAGFAGFTGGTAPIGNPSLVVVLLFAAGAFHWVYARLPELTGYDPNNISWQASETVGISVSILVRRVIAQIFFESGFVGVTKLGKEFSAQMHKKGLHLKIEGNKFSDDEFALRPVTELTDVYGLAFDEMHRILRRELGRDMGSLVISYGIDRLPWQDREVVAELILSRLPWGQSLTRSLAEAKSDRQTILKRVPLLVACTDAELNEIARHLKSEFFGPGETILKQGDPGDKFHIIERGQVTFWQADTDGMDRQVDEKGPGQYFGEVALVSDAPRNATAIAETPVALLSLKQADFNQLMRRFVSLENSLDKGVRHSWLLRGMPIFDELESHELDWLAVNLEQENLGAGEILFKQGDPGNAFYIVEAGELVITHEINGATVELSRSRAGEYVGEIALLQNRPRSATVRAVADTMLLKLDGEDFLDLVSGYTRLGQAMNRTSTRRLSFIDHIDATGQFTKPVLKE